MLSLWTLRPVAIWKGRGLVLTDSGRQLAAIGRECFRSLSDFAATSRQLPMRPSLAAPNSVAQWLILPRLKQLTKALPAVTWQLHHELTRDIVLGVQEGSYDFGFAPEEAVSPGLKKAVLGQLDYLLFVPRGLARGRKLSTEVALASLPLALPIGGSLRETVEQTAGRKQQLLNRVFECTSYVQAARLVREGSHTAMLPSIATAEFQLLKEKPLTFSVEGLAKRRLCLIWSGRTIAMRTALERAQQALVVQLAF